MKPSLRLAKELREIARLWDEGGLDGEGIFEFGLCRAIRDLAFGRTGYNYAADAALDNFKEVLGELVGPFVGYLRLHESEKDFWPARATFALLMAHWIEDQHHA